MAGIFGTDGVRSRINTGAMRAEFIVRLALAAGEYFITHNKSDNKTARPLVIIGKDTRLSGYMLEAALVSGFTSIGMDCRLTGPIPTAGVAYLTHSLRAELGVMISASHNPHYDNGIKLFGPDGFKLDDNIELEISNLLQGSISLAEPELLGRAKRMIDSVPRYVEFAKATFPSQLGLNSLKIVVDCANGAAYKTAPDTLHELGASVIPIGIEPDGININAQCGATSPEQLTKALKEHSADIGIALDGDADRLILSDEKGGLHDGDSVLAALALNMSQSSILTGPVTGTVMTNLGLERLLQSHKIPFQRTNVGDRYILEALKRDGGNLGGEPSGHILLPAITRCGDGLIAALKILELVITSEKPLSEILRLFEPVPQKLVNLSNVDKSVLQQDDVISQVTKIERELGKKGRLLLRPSGTEPLIRIMVEAEDPDLVDKIINDVTAILSSIR
ncbi:MAG: phosphoglucosamine mutase [Alphaproteobacteria bacterium]|nr:phosphoglucosamine mutase [Alphaproteobacteria bacterium]